MSTLKQKIIVILGTTASGKTSLGVKLARKFKGEIISADSRQVYKGMDVGTGKDLKEFSIFNFQFSKKSKLNPAKAGQKLRTVKIPYHLIDVVSPKTEFNLAKWLKMARKAISDVLSRGKVPIIVGGTGLYLQALVDGYELTDVKPNKKLRAKLEKKNIKQLLALLKKTDFKKWKFLNASERKNKRRLIRYIEVAKNLGGKVVIKEAREVRKDYDFLLIGLRWPKEVLEKRIYKRLIERLEKEKMIEEVRQLHKNGLSWKRLESFGLEYKYIFLYLQKKISYEEMVEKLFIAIRQFARRQMTWFRRWEKMGVKIKWKKGGQELENLVKQFLRK